MTAVADHARALGREAALFLLGVVAIALHMLDDSFVQPQPGTSAGEPKTLWEIPEAEHVGGLAARPAEYERRVVAFFDRALLRQAAS
jgi:hypothetical protein